MFKSPVILTAVGLWLIGLEAAAAPDFVTLGKHKAHPTRIVAKYARGGDAQVQATALNSLGLTVHRQFDQIPGLVVLDVDKTVAAAAAGAPQDRAAALALKINGLRNSGLFEYVEPSYVVTNLLVPSDSRFVDGTLWGLTNTGINGGVAGADINAAAAWDVTTGSTNVVVAVIDTGIRYTHRELTRQMWINPGEIPGDRVDNDLDGYVDNIYGINALADNGDPMDDNSHGTHVAGTIGAAAEDGFPHVGVAWKVQLMACKFLSADGFGFTDDAIQSINFAVAKEAKVLNNSWGGGPFSQALFDAIAAAQRKGVLFVAAAGNEANNNDAFPAYPASYQLDNIISVAALDRRDQLAYFSNFGQKSVHVGAPGVEIFSTTAQSDSSYDSYMGTSMATPHVTGVAALILAQYPKALLPEVKERILSTVTLVNSLNGKCVTRGRINAYKALTVQKDGVLETSFNPPSGTELLRGSTVPVFVTVTDLGPVTNATVVGAVQGTTQRITFKNDGLPPDVVAIDSTYSANLTVPATLGSLQINFTITAPGKSNLTTQASYLVVPPPPNDNFTNSLKVLSVGAVVQGTNKFASLETDEPPHAKVPTASSSLWWTWSPLRDVSVIVDTDGSSFDTVLAVYTNANLSTLKEIASVDDVGTKQQGYVTFNAKQGTSYRIAVAGYDASAKGTVRLRVEPGGQPDTNAPSVVITSPSAGLVVTDPNERRLVVSGTATDPQPSGSGVKEVLVQLNNDLAEVAYGTTNWSRTNLLEVGINTIKVVASDFAGNVSAPQTVSVTYRPLTAGNDLFNNVGNFELTGSQGKRTADTTGATKEFGEPLHAGNDGGKSVWWYFRAPTDGVFFLSTTNSSFDTLLGVYVASNSPPRVSELRTIASNDDAFQDSGFSKLAQAVKAGTNYFVAVDGFGGSSGNAILEYSFTPATVYYVTVNISGEGLVTPGSGYYQMGSTLNLFAEAKPDQQFSHWENDVNSFENPFSFVVTNNTTVRAVFINYPFADRFKSGILDPRLWTTSGDAGWFMQTNYTASGFLAARSGSIPNFGRSSLVFNQRRYRAGQGSFDYKVSSESGWDFLEFLIDGKVIDRWSGEAGWLTYRFALSAGNHTLEWRYVKDGNRTSGLDAAFIDKLDLPLVPETDDTTAARLSLSQSLLGNFELLLEGQANQEYVIEVSEDLLNWMPVSTNVPPNGRIRYIDPNSTELPKRFYRAFVP